LLYSKCICHLWLRCISVGIWPSLSFIAYSWAYIVISNGSIPFCQQLIYYSYWSFLLFKLLSCSDDIVLLKLYNYSPRSHIQGHYLIFQIPRKENQLINSTIKYVKSFSCFVLIKHITYGVSISISACNLHINELHFTIDKSN
jgi:hypothetical protein